MGGSYSLLFQIDLFQVHEQEFNTKKLIFAVGN